MSKPAAPRRLYTPRTSRGISLRLDPETVGQSTEAIARFFGTGRYLLMQTMIVIVWIAVNLIAVEARFDPYPFILLNLAFSLSLYSGQMCTTPQNILVPGGGFATDQGHKSFDAFAALAPSFACSTAS